MSWILVGEIGAGIVYAIGFFTSLSDILDNGPSLKAYRKKYGHDLGLIVCGFYRGFVTVGWPAFGGLKFGVGAIRDTIRLAFTSKAKDLKKEIDA
jgi:hypothetical protein